MGKYASEVWIEVTYTFPNFIGVAVKIWEWIGNFKSHFKMDVITYPRCD